MKSATVMLAATFAFRLVADSRPARPVGPTAAIVDAFRTHAVVAVPAGHGDARGYAFGRALVTDSRLSGIVHDVVIEEGNARFQDVADRFVRGDDVPARDLRRIWRDTTQTGFGLDEPWEQSFHAVRETNLSRPPERRIRVLLADPPIDWETVKTRADHGAWIDQRDRYPADLIEQEVVARHRRALLMYGQMHFQRKNIVANYESEGPAETVVSRLEHTWGATVFTIFTVGRSLATLQRDVAACRGSIRRGALHRRAGALARPALHRAMRGPGRRRGSGASRHNCGHRPGGDPERVRDVGGIRCASLGPSACQTELG
jgi:hypothetical protein